MIDPTSVTAPTPAPAQPKFQTGNSTIDSIGNTLTGALGGMGIGGGSGGTGGAGGSKKGAQGLPSLANVPKAAGGFYQQQDPAGRAGLLAAMMNRARQGSNPVAPVTPPVTPTPGV